MSSVFWLFLGIVQKWDMLVTKSLAPVLVLGDLYGPEVFMDTSGLRQEHLS